ncbi:DUF3040 domain-containing protein [Xylanimonas oleitrophica]|uniref:DUF3040 domain-containing protein n=1 Tax=Xylanimonas oleitrophica TaxID=2607479 RepID=A0A2W5X4L4_9MICO|nr:DUF3040 domain-containing protein [Xylanimonas oleitrophica]PZR55435.1 DUF3040 domain-containing protein [Xylanimonas oleitrophica]
MPLSEYEQRVLEQMERALTSDDPRLANTLQSTGRRPVARYVVAGIGLVVGLLVLVLGAVTTNAVVGVVGFVVMFAAVAWAFAFAPRRQGPEGVVREDGTVGPRPPAGGDKRAPRGGQNRNDGFLARLEERWERRRDQGR